MDKKVCTNDEIIRFFLRRKLEKIYANTSKKIVEELGVDHGSARVDIAVINGDMHGYEIKSDKDTLQRLPDQMSMYNAVFDRVTLVVGRSHLYEAVRLIPEWWGIEVAKAEYDGSIVFNCIREADVNMGQDSVSIARLLWKREALEILDSMGEAEGLYGRPRSAAYEKLADLLDQESLGAKVKEVLFSRKDWRSDWQPVLDGG